MGLHAVARFGLCDNENQRVTPLVFFVYQVNFIAQNMGIRDTVDFLRNVKQRRLPARALGYGIIDPLQ